MAFPLTEEQKRIVDDRGGELLVSAAAGSGKTRVLVERLMDRVTREGLDLDQFLVITYTKAAAGELRARIAQELSARLAEAPNDRHLRRQTALVYQAQISTIHAFCAALLRESGHLLNLDPDFRLCDEGEGHVMMAQVLEDVLEEQYQGIDPEGDFALLVDTLSAGRDDSRLAQIVLDVFGRIQSHPEPLRWLEEQKAAWVLDLDGQLAEMFGAPVAENKWPEEDAALLMPAPHEEVYQLYLICKIDYYNQEMELYANDRAVYEAAMQEAQAWYRRTHRPGIRWKWRVM